MTLEGNPFWAEGSWFGVPQSLLKTGAIRKLSRADITVYLAIASHAQFDTAFCWPSLDRLAALAGVSERTVRRSIDNLEEYGLVEKTRGGGGRSGNRGITNQYELIDPEECWGGADVIKEAEGLRGHNRVHVDQANDKQSYVDKSDTYVDIPDAYVDKSDALPGHSCVHGTNQGTNQGTTRRN